MTKTKSTKRALLLSALSLLMCVSMLIGSTFAWFTDSVTVSGNKIQSGTLDIALEMWNGTEWVNAEGETLNFISANGETDILWEPGATYQLPKLRVVNKGNLAAKYQVQVTGIAGDAKLNEAIKWYGYYEVTQQGVQRLQRLPWNNFTSQTYVVTPAGETWGMNDDKSEFQIEGVMNKNAGNEYQGLTIEGISITVVATQATYEYDSKDNQYDLNAEFPEVTVVSNAADLADALANGENAVLSEDIADAPVNTKAPYGNYYGIALNGGVFDGNGKSLDFNEGELNNGKLDNYGIMVSAGTIKNVDITGVFRGIVIMNPTDDIYIDNVTIGGEDVCYAINTAEGDGTHSLIVTNSTIAGWNSYGTAIKDLSFTDCTFAQGEYYTDVFGRLVKPYVTTVFENCEFNSKYYIDLSALEDGCTITLKNCTVNGVKLTAENWKDLIVAEDACGNGQISIEGKDGTYMSASNIFDYVVIE